MIIESIPAKSVSYGGKRNLSSVKAIVIHYTGNKNDTAVNNAKYFKNTNTRAAGAHYFVDQKGNIVQSINPVYVAYSVGGSKYSDCAKTGGGKYYKTFTNANTVSIELCDIVDKEPSSKMIKSVSNLIQAIRKTCPNAQTIVRHFDVNGKHCPASMMDNSKWQKFLQSVSNQKAETIEKSQTVPNTTQQTTQQRRKYKMPTIKKGSKNKAVMVWQIILGMKGKDVDGIFGANTERKTIEYQAMHNLKKDGIVGDKTWEVGMDSLWQAV